MSIIITILYSIAGDLLSDLIKFLIRHGYTAIKSVGKSIKNELRGIIRYWPHPVFYIKTRLSKKPEIESDLPISETLEYLENEMPSENIDPLYRYHRPQIQKISKKYLPITEQTPIIHEARRVGAEALMRIDELRIIIHKENMDRDKAEAYIGAKILADMYTHS